MSFHKKQISRQRRPTIQGSSHENMRLKSRNYSTESESCEILKARRELTKDCSPSVVENSYALPERTKLVRANIV